MDDEVVGWLSNARSTVYHSDMEHAMRSDSPPVAVTSTEVIKLAFKPCRRCSGPKAAPVPEYVSATAAALRTMFVVEGTEDEVNQMAKDFLHDLAESGYRVTRIPQRKKVEKKPEVICACGHKFNDHTPVLSGALACTTCGCQDYVDSTVTLPLDFSGVDDDEEVDEIVAELLEEGYGNGVASPGPQVPPDQCSYFNGSARRCALSADHDGDHIYLITTTQEGTTA